MRTPKQSRSAVSTEEMLHAVLDLVESGGLNAVTIAAVSERSGVSNGSIYHRFGGRDGLVRGAQRLALSEIEDDTAHAFSAADTEGDDDRATLMLAYAALDIFSHRRGVMAAFLVLSDEDPEMVEVSRTSTHRIAAIVTRWLRERLGASPPQAEAAWRLLFSLGTTQALFDDSRVSLMPLDRDVLAASIAAAVRRITEL